MFKDLIKYNGLEEACAEAFGFSGVTFLRDFGPWKKDDEVESLWFDLEDGTVEEVSDSGDKVKEAKFKLISD